MFGLLLEVELRCRKSARRCSAKHISKSKVSKSDGPGPPLAVEMSKKILPLWREAHVQVKMLKAPHARTTFEASEVVLRGTCKGGTVTLAKSEQHVNVL